MTTLLDVMPGVADTARQSPAAPVSEVAAAEPARQALIDAAAYAFVRDGFQTLLTLSPRLEPHLRGVLTDVLSHPGSLVRAQLAYSVMTALGASPDAARAWGCAVEYFHTASLLFDDLPCMDNATHRRGHACPHLTHGEGAAILGALALINDGYRLLWSVLTARPDAVRAAATALVSQCLGAEGILNGQAHDLYFDRSPHDEKAVLQVASGKTVTLTRLTLVMPALIGGAAPAHVDALEAVAASWGLSYQIMDDFKDFLMGPSDTGKTTSRDRVLDRPNLPLTIGCEPALQSLNTWLTRGRAAIEGLTGSMKGLDALLRLQSTLEAERRNLVVRLARGSGASVAPGRPA